MTKYEIENAIKKFINSERVTKVIKTINKTNCSGWEAWLQIEFAYFLSNEANSENEFEWWREYKIHTVQDEKSNESKFIIPDFWISNTDHGSEENSYFLIEFKRSNNGDVLKYMKLDIDKWIKHIKADDVPELECPGYKTVYHNSGVFFVGIDLNKNADPLSYDHIHLEKLAHNEELKENGQCFTGFYYNYFLDPKDIKTMDYSPKN